MRPDHVLVLDMLVAECIEVDGLNQESSYRGINTHNLLIPPVRVGLKAVTDFAPTVSIACFGVQDTSISDVEHTLKKALYNPSKDKKTDNTQFRISVRGLLFTK